MSQRKRVGVLISGRGSNLAALIEAARDPGYPAEVALVISNKAGALGLTRASEAGITTAVIDHKPFKTREPFDAALTEALRAARVDLVCNAGFMRLHSASLAASSRSLGRAARRTRSPLTAAAPGTFGSSNRPQATAWLSRTRASSTTRHKCRAASVSRS